MNTALQYQHKVLRSLLKRSQHTKFGIDNDFAGVLKSKDIIKHFCTTVTVRDYNAMYTDWWHRIVAGETNVCWPGKIKYLALSSGTSDAATKYIPLTPSLLRSNKKIMTQLLLRLFLQRQIPLKLVFKSWLMIGGCTTLRTINNFSAGDLTGIVGQNIPWWFKPLYKPGRTIADIIDWNTKTQEIAKLANKWDIGFIVGMPMWVQITLEKIIEEHAVQNIHEVWPNLQLYIHGGVSFEPYKQKYNQLLGKKIAYINSYLASEGYIALQNNLNSKGLQLILNQGIFYEFIPFDEQHFDQNGNLLSHEGIITIEHVLPSKEYAVVITTNGGAWRYLIGDTIKFIDVERWEIIVTGRTKHYLNVVGEHLSIDNMNKAIEYLCESFNLSITEFTVTVVENNARFIHEWYISTDKNSKRELITNALDNKLQELNEDYETERRNGALNINVVMIPENKFLEFLSLKNKTGGQHKFPRILKNELLEEWKQFLSSDQTLPA